MMVLWDKKEVNVKELGEYLYLDSGTLTPLLKKLENKKYINRVRSKKDERNLIISITELGMELKNKAKDIPSKISKCIEMEGKDAIELYKLLHKILLNFKD